MARMEKQHNLEQRSLMIALILIGAIMYVLLAVPPLSSTGNPIAGATRIGSGAVRANPTVTPLPFLVWFKNIPDNSPPLPNTKEAHLSVCTNASCTSVTDQVLRTDLPSTTDPTYFATRDMANVDRRADGKPYGVMATGKIANAGTLARWLTGFLCNDAACSSVTPLGYVPNTGSGQDSVSIFSFFSKDAYTRPQIKYGPDGKPIIASFLSYESGFINGLYHFRQYVMFIHCQNETCAHTQAAQDNVDHALLDDLGDDAAVVWGDYGSSHATVARIALDLTCDGKPVVAYTARATDPGTAQTQTMIKLVYCNDLACTTHTTKTIDYPYYRDGQFLTMRVNPVNCHVNVASSQYFGGNPRLQFIDCTNSDCSQSTQSILNTGRDPSVISLAYDPNGNPVIGTQNFVTNDPNDAYVLYHCADPSCTSASETAIHGVADTSYHNGGSLDFQPNGALQIFTREGDGQAGHYSDATDHILIYPSLACAEQSPTTCTVSGFSQNLNQVGPPYSPGYLESVDVDDAHS